jgi:predicted hotdog family 3-hydroxylacyl-ACP dehydratase
MNDYADIPVKTLLPQQPPFIMVDRLMYCDESITDTELTVRNDNIFYERNILREPGIIENIAQTCAARIGYLNRLNSEEVRVGVIGAIKDLHIYSNPKEGDTLSTRIVVLNEVMGVTLVKATVMTNGELIAECEMKIAVNG